MNPLYQQLSGGMQQPAPTPMNPFQKMGAVMQAMRNPQQFIKQSFPDIPDNISNDPNQILSYLQQTRGISNQQIQNLVSMYGGR